ncbi:MAG: HEPN domain-containing protein [Candidatus Helarchaeota archaeon]|nr:HEPN domain-containing protein [Candidatus Helarchaeota archaeon]
MSQIDFAKDYLDGSKLRLETAENALNKNVYAYCIRQCQEATELSLKAALKLIGIDYPKWHDVGIVLVKEKVRFPSWFQKIIPKLNNISKLLASQREAAMYGIEISKKSPSSVFTKENAENALEDAKFCVNNVEKLLNSIVK